jgi:hypothetical protein
MPALRLTAIETGQKCPAASDLTFRGLLVTATEEGTQLLSHQQSIPSTFTRSTINQP